MDVDSKLEESKWNICKTYYIFQNLAINELNVYNIYAYKYMWLHGISRWSCLQLSTQLHCH